MYEKNQKVSNVIERKRIDEETEWNPEKPNTDYAISKYGAEMEVWRAHYEGLPSIIINPGVIIGTGNWGNSSGDLFKKSSQTYTLAVKKTHHHLL